MLGSKKPFHSVILGFLSKLVLHHLCLYEEMMVLLSPLLGSWNQCAFVSTVVEGAAPIAAWFHMDKAWEQEVYLICERQTSNLGLRVVAGDSWGFFSVPSLYMWKKKKYIYFQCFPLLKMEIVIDCINSKEFLHWLKCLQPNCWKNLKEQLSCVWVRGLW